MLPNFTAASAPGCLLTISLTGLEKDRRGVRDCGAQAGDTEETDVASVLEAVESSEPSSTFFPKSCKMQFRNWGDRHQTVEERMEGGQFSAGGMCDWAHTKYLCLPLAVSTCALGSCMCAQA